MEIAKHGENEHLEKYGRCDSFVRKKDTIAHWSKI